MKKIEHYYSSDYAGLDCNGISFYFGYEETKNEEYAFVAKKDGKEVMRLAESEIKAVSDTRQLNNMMDYLICGVGMFLNANITKL